MNADANDAEHSKRGAGGFKCMPRGLSLLGTNRSPITRLRRVVGAGRNHCAHQQKSIDALTSGLQKVSVQLELSKSAPQTVVNNH